MNIEYLLLAYAGLLLHYLMRWKEVVEAKKNFELSKEIPSFLVSILTTTLLVYVGKDMVDIYPLTPATSILLGYGNQSIFGKLLKIKGAKTDTP